MNERAREVLVNAAMRGVPQLRHVLSDGEDGRCAMGVLNEAATGRPWWPAEHFEFHLKIYDISPNELREIVKRNNIDGWDFLTIARKVGVQEETHAT